MSHLEYVNEVKVSGIVISAMEKEMTDGNVGLLIKLKNRMKTEINGEIAEREFSIQIIVSIPLLVNLNKGGVAMIAALKIVFIYSVLGMEFTTETFFLTMLIAVLSAIIVGGVPGGAFLGEIFIVTTLGLPMEAIPMLVVLGTITDAPATLINVIHDLNAAQIVERFAGKKQTNTEINSTAAVV